MAWNPPRTWIDGETPTAAMFNAHVRDNYTILKVSRNDLGRVNALTSDYVDDLDGTAIEGLVLPNADTLHAAGRHRFIANAKLRVPVGADKYETDITGKVPGSLWVEGLYLHHVDPFRQEWRYLGNLISAAGAAAGYVMVASNGLRYTDESGNIRECVASASAYHSDAAAIGGSLWVDAHYTGWIRETGTQAYVGHSDVTHADHSDHFDHSDHADAGSPHGDSSHSDVGGFHIDHSDGPTHVDHTDHTDVPHSDHTDHSDITTHQDGTPHGDVDADSRPVTVA
jgi:hypothetical protein